MQQQMQILVEHTMPACQALLSRLYLYAASPLFNKNNDKTKWEKAY